MGPRRAAGHGLAVLVASEDALDQYFMREPEALLGRRIEAAIPDHTNTRVLDGHVLAAAFEAPIDDERPAPTLGEGGGRSGARAAGAPQDRRRLRLGRSRLPGGACVAPFRERGLGLVVGADDGAVLGVVERERAYSTVHDGAVYLHLGQGYLVEQLDLTAATALVEPFSGDWYTQAKKDTETAIEESLRIERAAASSSRSARVSVSEHVVAYQKRATRDGATLETVPLDLPPRPTRPRPSGSSRPTHLAGIDRCRSSSQRSTPPSTR